MQYKHCFKAVDCSLQDILNQDKLFSDIPIIFDDDFI